MPGSMDERVVSMEFDNKQFEKNVKTSIHTLDELKESLNFEDSADSLDELEGKFRKFGKNNVFKDMDSSVSSLRKGLGLLGDSTTSLIHKFGEAMQIVTILEMAESAVRRLEASIKQFTIQPITEGFAKYTEKIASIKTISNATGLGADAVNESLQRLNWFTDETSYSFSEMVNNIGKFTSVGRGLDESIDAMQGIATWAAQSGANTQEAARAMYNLSQAMGTGAVKLMDWKSIENAGMATKEFKEQAIAAAEAAGLLVRKGDKLFSGKQEVNVSNFNSTLAKGWFTSDVLMKTLDKYGSFASEVKKYQEAHPQYQLATEAMEAMDAERLEKQAKLYEENLGKMMEASGKGADAIKQDIAKINKIAATKEREKEIKSFAKTYNMSVEDATKLLNELASCEETLGEKAFKSAQQSKSFADSINATKDAVSTQWMNSFQTIFGGLDESVKLWSDVTEIMWDLFAADGDARNNALTHWAEEFGGREDLWGKDGIMHSIMDTIIDMKDLLGSSFKDVFFPSLMKSLNLIDGSERSDIRNGLYTADQLRYIREGSYFGYKIKEVTAQVRDFGLTIRNFFTNEENVEKIGNIFRGIATVVQMVGRGISGFFGMLGDVAKRTGIFQTVLTIASNISTKIQEFSKRVRDSGFVTKIFEKIGNNIVWFYDLLKKWGGQISAFFEETGIGQTIRNFFNGILEFFIGGSDDVDEQGNKTESKFFRAFGWIQNVKDWLNNVDLKSALMNVKFFFDNFGTIWGAFTGAVSGNKIDKTGMSDQLLGLVEAAENVGSKISGIGNFFKGIYEAVTGWLESSGILPTLRSFGQGVKEFFENIGFIWSYFIRGDKSINPKDMTKKQRQIVTTVTKFIIKVRNVFWKLRDWFNGAVAWLSEKWNIVVGWLESSGILPKIRNVWKTITDFFGNIGLLWDIFVNKQGKYDPKDLTEDQLSIVQKIEQFILKVKEKFEWIKNKFTEIKNTVVGWLEDSGILPTLRNWWTDITGWFESLRVPEGEGGPLESVKRFFVGLGETVSNLFKGNPQAENAVPALPAGEKKPGLFDTMFANIKEAFTNDDGTLNLSKGFAKSIAGAFAWITETLGGIDWSSGFDVITKFFVDGINSLDDALKDVHVDNIVSVMSKLLGVFNGVIWGSAIANIFSTIKSIVKKGNDKTLLEQFTDLIRALGEALLQIGISVALIAGSIWLLSTIKEDQLNQATKIMIGIGAFFLGVMVAAALIHKFSVNPKQMAKTFAAIGAMFIQIGLAVALIVASIWLITKMVGENGEIGEKMKTALLVVAGILFVMGTIIVAISWLTSKAGTLKIAGTIGAFAGIAIILATVTVCIMLLQGIDNLGKAAANAGILAGVLVVLGICMRIIGAMQVTGPTVALAFSMALILGVVTAALILLQNVDITTSLQNAGILVGTLVVMSLCMRLLNGLNISGKTILAALSMTFIMGAITAVFILLKDMDGVQLLAKAGAIAGLIAILTGAIAGLSFINPAGALNASLAIGAFVTALSAAVSLGGIMIAGAAKLVINELVSIMSSLGAASISAQGIDKDAIVDALKLLDDIAASLVKIAGTTYDTKVALAIAHDAWIISNRLNLAGTSAHDVDVSSLNAVFGEDGSGGVLNAIKTAFSGITDTGSNALTLGQNAAAFGRSLQALGASGKSMGEGGAYEKSYDNIVSALTSVQKIVELASGLGAAGEEGAISVDLTATAQGIANIGSALQLYNIALAKAEEEAAKSSGLGEGVTAPLSTENIRSALESVISAIPASMPDMNQISAVEAFGSMTPGEGGSTLFALGLVNVANAMTEFSNAAEGFSSENTTKAIGSLQMLADIKTQTEGNPGQYQGTISGIASWKLNQNSSFADSIIAMGNAMSAFGESVKDIKYEYVEKAITAIQMLVEIKNQLSGNEDAITYFTAENWLGKFTVQQGSEAKDAATIFAEFGEGIGLLGSALETFSTSIAGAEKNYDADKVASATAILQDMAAMQIALRQSKMDQGWWTTDENLETMGQNLSGLGSRLTQFSTELASFDLDVDSDKWKNISGVMTFLVKAAQDLGTINDLVQKTVWNGASNYQRDAQKVEEVSYTLKNLGDDMVSLIDGLVKFSEAMNAVHTVNMNGEDKTYQLGEWAQERWDNISSMITFFKDITKEFKVNDIREGAFYDLKDFGYDLAGFFDWLNGSQFFSFMGSLSVPVNADAGVTSMQKFAEVIKGLADATAVLHTSSVDLNDITKLEQLLTAIMSLDTSDFSIEAFSLSGITMAAEFLSGFASRLSQAEGSDGASMSGAFTELLATIAGYSTDFYEQGKTAGEQYASGFKAGMAGVGAAPLSPIVNMDAFGNTGGGDPRSMAELLRGMNFATSTDAQNIITSLDSINGRFNRPIAVNDSHQDVVTAVNLVSARLYSIGQDVDALRTQVNNLRVFINGKTLVGAIANDMDRALGSRINLINVTRP